MNLIKTWFLVLALHFTFLIHAQVNGSITPDESNTSAPGNANASEYSETLEQYLKHPIDINTADRGTLYELHLLSSNQINALVLHRINYGAYLSLLELQSVPGFDIATIKSVLPYLYISNAPISLKNSFKTLKQQGEHTLVLGYEQPLQSVQGFKNGADSNATNDYVGGNFKTNLRYRYSNKSGISLGFNAGNDIGEPFFNKKQPRGFDFYSAHCFIKNQGILKQLALGDYNLSIGQGLGIGSGFVLNKSIEVLQIHRYAAGLRPYRSMNEFGFFRGAAATLGTDKLSLLVFGSWKKVDGNTLLADTSLVSEQRFFNLIQTGKHRTLKELALKNTSLQKVYGAYLQTQLKKIHAGIGYHRNILLKMQQLLHADFNYSSGNYLCFAEVAFSDSKGRALLSGLMASLHKNLDCTFIYRNYNSTFNNSFANAMSNASSPTNESGIYCGLNLQLNAGLRLLGYADWFRSDQPKYRTNGPSHGNDYAGAVQFQKGKNFKLEIRFRSITSQANIPASQQPVIAYLVTDTRNTMRLQCDYSMSKQFALSTRIEQTEAVTDGIKSATGMMLFQDIHFGLINGKINLDLRYYLYNSNGAAARMYAFENDVPYSFSMTQLSGAGSRYYAMINYKIRRNLSLWLKYSSDFMPYETQIGSGLDKINGNHAESIKLLLKIIL